MPCTRICFSGQHQCRVNLSPLRKPVMAAVGLRSEFPNVFCGASGKPPFLKTKAGGSATENPSCRHDRSLRSLNRAGAMPSLRWGGQLFAPPNNGMHRTHPAQVIGLKAGCVVLASPVMPAVGFLRRGGYELRLSPILPTTAWQLS